MRTIVEIPESDIKTLDILCHTFHISRAEAIRRAVNLYIEESKPELESAFGLWKKEKINSLKYEQKLRSEWQ